MALLLLSQHNGAFRHVGLADARVLRQAAVPLSGDLLAACSPRHIPSPDRSVL